MAASRIKEEREAAVLESRVLEKLRQDAKPKSEAELASERALAELDKLGQQQIGDESILWEGTKFVLPASLGGSMELAITYLTALAKAEETEFVISRVFQFRPWDGAAAFERTMKRVFGTVGVGKVIHSRFGDQPPEYRTVQIGTDETMQVPWGRVEFSPMGATFDLGADRIEDGLVFALSATAPRKHRRRIEGFLQVVASELREHSIYRGKAIDAGEDPGFVDLSKDPATVIYTGQVMRQLEVNVWTVLKYAAELRAQKQSLKRAVLLEGPYGSGKTLAGVLTGQQAVASGWTFIQVRPGDDPYMALRTAKLYAPAVVWIEDIDVLFAGKSREEVSKLLDALDSVQNKGAEVLCGFTTNFADVLEKGVLRPGRIDAVIHIGGLDAEAQQRLVRAIVPAAMLAANVDWKAVTDAFGDFLPSFGVEAVNRAIRYALVRGGGRAAPISTTDLVDAAEDLGPQLKMLEKAEATRHAQPSLGGMLEKHFETVLNRAVVEDIAKIKVNTNGTG